jgi:hypothetical protein
MKNSIFATIAFIAVASITSPVFAQVAAKTAGYDLKKNVKCRIVTTESGCSVIFDNQDAAILSKKGYDYYKAQSSFSVSSSDNSVSEVVSPRDAASGLPTGKRQHKPMTITKELDKSTPKLAESVSGSGGGSGKVSMQDMSFSKVNVQDISFTKRCAGKSSKLAVVDGECVISTADCPNGSCSVMASWSWGATNSSRCSVDFLLEIEDGVCTAMAINEKGTSGNKGNKK